MEGDAAPCGAQNPQDQCERIMDPILIDIGFDKKHEPHGANIIHPYLVLGTLPDKLWYLQSPDLFADELVFGRYGWGDIVPWSSLQASGLLERTDWQLVKSASVVRAAYATATSEARRAPQRMSLGPRTPTDSPPSSDDEAEMS